MALLGSSTEHVCLSVMPKSSDQQTCKFDLLVVESHGNSSSSCTRSVGRVHYVSAAAAAAFEAYREQKNDVCATYVFALAYL